MAARAAQRSADPESVSGLSQEACARDEARPQSGEWLARLSPDWDEC